MAHKELVSAWLKDAYGMEMALIPVLEQHAKDAKAMPEAARRIEQHAQETRQHAEWVKTLIEARGESINPVKSALGDMMGAVQSVATAPFKDEPVKNALQDYAAEHFEMACYNALIVAGQQEGDQQLVRVCQQILQQEQDMANFLQQGLPTVVKMELQKAQMEHSH